MAAPITPAIPKPAAMMAITKESIRNRSVVEFTDNYDNTLRCLGIVWILQRSSSTGSALVPGYVVDGLRYGHAWLPREQNRESSDVTCRRFDPVGWPLQAFGNGAALVGRELTEALSRFRRQHAVRVLTVVPTARLAARSLAHTSRSRLRLHDRMELARGQRKSSLLCRVSDSKLSIAKR